MKVWRMFEKILYEIVFTLLTLMGKNYSKAHHRVFMQFLKFCLVGISNAIVYYLVYAGNLLVFRKYDIFRTCDYQIAQVLGFILSVFWAFSINRKYVFQADGKSYFLSLGKFYLSYAFTGLFLNSILLFIWKSIGISEFIAPFINILFTTPINYLMSKFWAFKKTRDH